MEMEYLYSFYKLSQVPVNVFLAVRMDVVSKIPSTEPKFLKDCQPLLRHNELHFNLPVADDFKSSQLQQILAGLQEQEHEQKLRITSSESQGVPESPTRADHASTQAEHEQVVHKKASQNLKTRCDIIRNQLQQMEKARAMIMNVDHDWVKARMAQRQIAELDTTLYFATYKLEYLLENCNRLLGVVQDEYIRKSVNDPAGSAYIDLLLEKQLQNKSSLVQYRLVPARNLVKDYQDAWKVQLIQYYHARDPANPTRLWCPVSHAYIESEYMEAVHIVPYALGEHNARHVFGVPDYEHSGHLYDVRNGLLVHSRVARALETARIAILPTDFVREGPDYRCKLFVFLLDRSVHFGCTYGDLSGRTLEFKHGDGDLHHRPRLCYLYYRLCTAVLARQRSNRDGWARQWRTFLGKRFWCAPPKGWIEHSAMIAIVKRVGAVKELLELLDAGDMATGEFGAGSTRSAGEWDERAALAAYRTTVQQPSRWEIRGYVDNYESDLDEDSTEENVHSDTY